MKQSSSLAVFRAEHKLDRQIYAVTAQQAVNPEEEEVLLREVQALSSFWANSHGSRHVLRYFAAWREKGLLHVQTEPFECSLRERLEPNAASADPNIASEDLLAILCDTASGLAALHASGVAHTDLTPDAILVGEQGQFVIGCLGRSQSLSIDGQLTNTAAATNDYSAPEVIEGTGVDLFAADIFSLALIVCEAAMFHASELDRTSTLAALRRGCVPEDHMSLLDQSLTDLLLSMLSAQPSDRPACGEILERADAIRRALTAARRGPAPSSAESKVVQLRQALREAKAQAEQSKVAAEAKRRQLSELESLVNAKRARAGA